MTMDKRDELSDSNSCLNRAAPDEPVFVLRANDELAPDLVREWAHRYTELKAADGGLSARQVDKRDEAFRLADRMLAWKDKQGK